MNRIILFQGAPLSSSSFRQFCNTNGNAIIYYDFPFYNLDSKISNAIYIGKIEHFRYLDTSSQISIRFEQLIEGSIDINIHRVYLYPIIRKKIIIDYIVYDLKAEIYDKNFIQKLISIVRELRYYNSIGWDEEYNFVRILVRLIIAFVLLKLKISLGKSNVFSNLTASSFLIKRKSQLNTSGLLFKEKLRTLPKITTYLIEYLVRNIACNYDLRPFVHIKFNVEWSPLQAFFIEKANSKCILTTSIIHGSLWEPLLHNTYKSKILLIPEGEEIYCSLNNGSTQVYDFDYSRPSNSILTLASEEIRAELEGFKTVVFLSHGFTGMSYKYSYDTNFKCIDLLNRNFNGKLKVKLHPSEKKFVYRKLFPGLCFIKNLDEIKFNDIVIGYGTSALYQLNRKGLKVYFLKL